MGFKSRGPESVGRLVAPNASCWCVICDALDAASWDGDDGFDYGRPLVEYLPEAPSDFARAMRAADGRLGELDVGPGRGVVATLSTSGSSYIWRTDRGLGALEHFPSDELEEEPTVTDLGERFAGIATNGKPRHLGTFEVHSGLLAIFLPFTRGPFAAKDLRAAARSKRAVSAGDFRLLVSLPNGRYNVFVDRLGRGLGHEDDLGVFPSRVRIER